MFLDRPGIENDRASIESCLSTPLQRAAFNAARSRHSGDWLLALPITSCGLKLDDEVVRVAVGTRLALKLCVPHQCRCGSEVDSFGRNSLVCKREPGRAVRHHHLNDVIASPLPQPASWCPRNHLVLVFQTENAHIDSVARGQVSYMGCDGDLHNCRFLFGSFFSRGRRCSRVGSI